MEERKESPYEALPTQELFNLSSTQDSGQHKSTADGAIPTDFEQRQPKPQLLQDTWTKKLLRLVFDLIISAIALLFAVFGILVYQNDGGSAAPNSTGQRLHEISQYGPTIFPVLFAAVVGGALKSLASWRIQTARGSSIGLIEQCVGSQTLSRAITTQINLRTFNLLGALVVIIWCLSPLGSQASLRVIAVVPSLSGSGTTLDAFNTFNEYVYGWAVGNERSSTVISAPVTASIMAAKLLGGRNQDLWGNVRLPAIERLETTDGTGSGWVEVPGNDNLTYPSLVGVPISPLSPTGITTFTLNGSYLSISCPVFGKSSQTQFTNFSSADAPSPGNDIDCDFASSMGGTQYQIAISAPCETSHADMNSRESRNARKLLWESVSGEQEFTRAECDLTTTYVEANVNCSASSTRDTSGSVCDTSLVRRSVDPPRHSNWTVFDLGQITETTGPLELLTGLFPHAELANGTQPVVTYMVSPFSAVGGREGTAKDTPAFTVGRYVSEVRLAQLLNTVLYIGIDSDYVTGTFNSSENYLSPSIIMRLEATVATPQDIVRCNQAWLGVLLVSSLVVFLCGLVSAALRMITLAPDLLGSIGVVFLQNKVECTRGSSTWDSSHWARNLRNTNVRIGDVAPESEFGRIALGTTSKGEAMDRVKRGRFYL